LSYFWYTKLPAMRQQLLFLLVLLTSCAGYYNKSRDISNKYYSLDFKETYAVLKGIGGLPGVADQEYFYPQKFEINLPKQIKGIGIYGVTYIIEYDNEQIIAINPGYQNHNKLPKIWSLKDVSEREISEIQNYWQSRKYSMRIFDYPKISRTTRTYMNGEVTIVLFNIKHEDFESDLAFAKSFKYLD